MNRNENKANRQKLFFAFLIAGIILAASLQILWIPSVQQRILKFAESMLGRSLARPEKWIGIMKQSAVCFPFLFLTFAFCFYEFKIPASFQRQEITLKKYTGWGGYTKGFANFLKNHTLLCLFTVLTILAVYGIRLFSLNIGIDTNYAFFNDVLNWREIGRFGLVILKQFRLFGLNLYFQNFLALAFLCIGTLAWAYFISLFFPEQNKSSFFVFAALFVSSKVWVESLYFTCMNAETTFLIMVCPVVALLMFSGIFENNKKNIIASVIALVFMIAMYQAIIVMFFCALMICFSGCAGQKTHPEKYYVVNGAKIALLILISLLIYFALDKFFVAVVFHTQKSDYLTGMASKSFLRTICSPVTYVTYIYQKAPVEFFFFCVFPICIGIVVTMKKGIVHLLAFFAVLASIFALPVAGGGNVPLRAQYAFPLAETFFIWFALENTVGKFRKFLLIVCSIACVLQIEQSSMMNFTDEFRFLQDKNTALNIAHAVQKTDAAEQTPVFIYGKFSPTYTKNALTGEVPGFSIFEWFNSESPLDATACVSFINCLGFKFHAVSTNDKELIQKARNEASTMPDFPVEGSVRNLGDVVVVRLSESPFEIADNN